MSQVLFSLTAAFNPTLLTATTVMLLLPTPNGSYSATCSVAVCLLWTAMRREPR